jgi:membrane fusion protein, multidrug efflux system
MPKIRICLAACVVLSGAILLALTGCGGEEKAAASTRSGAPAPVLIADVERRDVPVQIRSIASVEPYTTVTIQSRVAGQLQKVHIAPGQEVKKRDLLFEIDPRPSQAALASAKASLAQGEAEANWAQADFKRTDELMASKVVSQLEYEQKKSAVGVSQAKIDAAKAAIENATLDLEFTRIYSPIDGRAGKLLADQGNIIKADDTPLLTINQLQPIYVAFSVPEQDLERVRKFNRPGQEPTVIVSIPGDDSATETGQLSFIDNQVDVDTGTIRLRATFSNESHRLWPGQFVQAALNLTVEKDRIVIPSRAVQVGQQGTFVFVLKTDMTVEMRPITVGRTLGEDSVIETGVEFGERVVTEGQLRLVPGAKAEIKATGPATAPATRGEVS